MFIEFAPFWSVIAVLMFIVLGLLTISALLFVYVKWMEYKWKKQDKELSMLWGEFNRTKNNPGGGI